MKWNLWSLYWLIWIVIGFGIPEAAALATNWQNTLSAQVWHAEGTGPTIIRYMVAAFIIWLFGHMVFEIWRS